jgi:hypothetical protein
MVLDIPNGLENVDKAKEEEVVTTSIGQSVDRIKQIGRPVTLIVAIWNSGLTNQKLNVIIVKR